MAIEIQVTTPYQVLTNQEIASWAITSGGKQLTEQSIFEKTGIKRRFIAQNGETVLDMGIDAVKSLQTRSISPDMVFFSTSYPNGTNNASRLVEHFQFPSDGFINIHAACSGFGLALATIAERKTRFSGNQTLIVASEKYSPTLVNLESGQDDPSLSQTIFSDGASAMLFTPDEDLEILNAVNYAFSKGVSECLRMPIDYNLVRHPSMVIDAPTSPNSYLWMDGRSVYEAVRTTLPDLIMDSINGAKLEPRQIRMIIPHQASRHMIDALAKRLPTLDFYRDLEDGNWSSASIPKAMARALDEGAIVKGDRLVLAGFGAGLFASVVVVQLN